MRNGPYFLSLCNIDSINHFSFQATLAILDKLDIETENPTEEEVARKFGWEDDYLADDLSLWQRVKPKIFSLFDEPHSSTCARVSKNGQLITHILLTIFNILV